MATRSVALTLSRPRGRRWSLHSRGAIVPLRGCDGARGGARAIAAAQRATPAGRRGLETVMRKPNESFETAVHHLPDWSATLAAAGIRDWRAVPVAAGALAALKAHPGLPEVVQAPSGPGGGEVRLRPVGSVWTIGTFRGTYTWDGGGLVFRVEPGTAPRGAFGPGGGVALACGEAGELVAWTIEAPPLPAPPLEEWLAGVDEPWLVREAGRLAASGAPWDCIVAGAMAWRLRRERADVVIAEVEALFRRGVRPGDAPDQAWARTWTPAQTLVATLHALAEADALLADLEHLEVRQGGGGDAELLGLRRRREALAGVARLIDVARSYPPEEARVTRRDLRPVLALVDAVGQRLVAALPPTGGGGDERDPVLRRVGALYDGAWWGARGVAESGGEGEDAPWSGLDA
jgi:hypothetical protein